jgi:hypothetical protein
VLYELYLESRPPTLDEITRRCSPVAKTQGQSGIDIEDFLKRLENTAVLRPTALGPVSRLIIPRGVMCTPLILSRPKSPSAPKTQLSRSPR